MSEINLKINGFDVAEIQRDLREIKNLFKNFQRPHEPEELMTRKEACEMLNVTDVTIWNWAKQGRVKTYKIGNRVMLKRSELLEEISNNVTKK